MVFVIELIFLIVKEISINLAFSLGIFAVDYIWGLVLLIKTILIAYFILIAIEEDSNLKSTFKKLKYLTTSKEFLRIMISFLILNGSAMFIYYILEITLFNIFNNHVNEYYLFNNSLISSFFIKDISVSKFNIIINIIQRIYKSFFESLLFMYVILLYHHKMKKFKK
jgi:hypothetical protein